VAPSSKGLLLRDERFAYLQYQEDASGGIELFDAVKDPRQYTNLAAKPEYAGVVAEYRAKLTAKLAEVRASDLARK
jgi:iduronate 2-sulfatase